MAAMTPDASTGGMPVLRAMAVAVAALTGATAVAVVALNRLPADERPALAKSLWPEHPDAMRDKAMRDIGVAAARSGAVPDEARRVMRSIALAQPLRVHPYLVEATIAATAGDDGRAERLFAAAVARDPRSLLAHFALADRYLKTARLREGLGEISVLARLSPGATNTLAGPIAIYAREPGSTAILKEFFVRSPQFGPLVLNELAKDAAQADRALTLGAALPAGGDTQWRQTLVQALIDKQQYGRALAAWRRLAAAPAGGAINNPGFAASPAPPPFNWAPFSTGGALAEAAPGGGVKLVYYGREEISITRQMLVLSPGRYTLSMAVGSGPVATGPGLGSGGNEGVAWQVTCVEGGAILGTLTLKPGASPAALRFAVPSSCPAQWLTLRGIAGQFGESVALTISALTLRKGSGE